VAARWQFTHLADAQARIALQNALFFGRKRASALVVPWCTYTEPEVAHVGFTPLELQERGTQHMTFTVPLTEIDRAVLDGDTEGFARLHVDSRGRILGATLVAQHAGESIGEISLAMTAGLSLGDLARTIHPYPTQSEVLRRLADAHRRQRLTPGVRRLLERYFRWRR
jgi:pyruvate/2-oxoglutarate dehydrogenase complex dihydrolipoamide dehydrogenase (E3) component